MSSTSIYNIKKNYYTSNYNENINLETSDATFFYKSLSIIDKYVNYGSSNTSTDLKSEYQQLIIADADNKLTPLIEKLITVVDAGFKEDILNDIDLEADILSSEDTQFVNHALTLYFKILLFDEENIEETLKKVTQVYKNLIKDLLSSGVDTVFPYMDFTFLVGQITGFLKDWDYLKGLIEFLNESVDIASEDEIMLSFLELVYGNGAMDAEKKESSSYFVEDLVFNSSGDNLFVNLTMINSHLSNKNYEEAEQLINKIKADESCSKSGTFYELFLIAQINYHLQTGNDSKEVVQSLREELVEVCKVNGSAFTNPYLADKKELSKLFDSITAKYL